MHTQVGSYQLQSRSCTRITNVVRGGNRLFCLISGWERISLKLQLHKNRAQEMLVSRETEISQNVSPLKRQPSRQRTLSWGPWEYTLEFRTRSGALGAGRRLWVVEEKQGWKRCSIISADSAQCPQIEVENNLRSEYQHPKGRCWTQMLTVTVPIPAKGWSQKIPSQDLP